MQNLTQPLTDEELERLADFLPNRVGDEHDDDPDFDCGIIDLSELDGFLTAIVSGPNVIPPSRWLPALWGAEEPVWDSMDEFQSIFSLLVRHMNSIVAMLESDPSAYEPMFSERHVEGETHLIVDDWCCGYMMGVELDGYSWQLTNPAITEMLGPISLFGTEEGWKELEGTAPDVISGLRDRIPQAVRDVYRYWLERRTVKAPSQRRAAPKVGRNDPCPCGSGKKYKHCCLQ